MTPQLPDDLHVQSGEPLTTPDRRVLRGLAVLLFTPGRFLLSNGCAGNDGHAARELRSSAKGRSGIMKGWACSSRSAYGCVDSLYQDVEGAWVDRFIPVPCTVLHGA